MEKVSGLAMKMMNKTVSLKQVIGAIESADDSCAQLYDLETGETVYLPDADITGEIDEELEASIDSHPGRYLRFPTKYEIHEYRIMENFIDELPAGAAKQELAGAIRGKGAFHRFKNGIRYHRIEQNWYDYLAAAHREIAVKWCLENGLGYIEENGKEVRLEDLEKAHSFCSNNKPSLAKDKLCGCFYCLEIFDPSQIAEYVEVENDCDSLGTAVCPYCGIDSVIGESSGYPITTDFLQAMYFRWFK